VERHGGVDGVVTLTISTVRDRDLRPAIAAALVQAGWGLRELRPMTLSLEEIFLTLVGGRQGADAQTGRTP
jgi:hypothetical protein